MSKHTKGPWKIWDNSAKTPETYRIVSEAIPSSGLAICGSKADANLIAIAPELLEFLEHLVKGAESHRIDYNDLTEDDLLKKAKALINKAKGK